MALKIVEADMRNKFSNIVTSSNVKVGGIDYVADVMNNLRTLVVISRSSWMLWAIRVDILLKSFAATSLLVALRASSGRRDEQPGPHQREKHLRRPGRLRPGTGRRDP